jgi:hypothetical protein
MKEYSIKEVVNRESYKITDSNRAYIPEGPPLIPDIITERPVPGRKQGWKRPYKYHK